MTYTSAYSNRVPCILVAGAVWCDCDNVLTPVSVLQALFVVVVLTPVSVLQALFVVIVLTPAYSEAITQQQASSYQRNGETHVTNVLELYQYIVNELQRSRRHHAARFVIALADGAKPRDIPTP